MMDGSNVRVDAYKPRTGQITGMVILCHGFRGHRRWGFFPQLCSRLQNAGIIAFAMDFSLNGYVYREGGGRSHEHARFDPEVFRKNTISREFNDLAEVVRYIASTPIRFGIPPGTPIGLYGHSRGALSVILHALENGSSRAICTWATTSNPNFYTDNQKESWRRNGFYEFTDSKNGSSLALDLAYLEDLESNSARYDFAERIRTLKVPHLLVHGTMDLVVPSLCTEKIHQAETDLKDKQMILLKTGHTFGFTDESIEFSPAFETACENTVLWFQKYLTIRS
jgi:dienelactone hydrolase